MEAKRLFVEKIGKRHYSLSKQKVVCVSVKTKIKKSFPQDISVAPYIPNGK